MGKIVLISSLSNVPDGFSEWYWFEKETNAPRSMTYKIVESNEIKYISFGDGSGTVVTLDDKRYRVDEIENFDLWRKMVMFDDHRTSETQGFIREQYNFINFEWFDVQSELLRKWKDEIDHIRFSRFSEAIAAREMDLMVNYTFDKIASLGRLIPLYDKDNRIRMVRPDTEFYGSEMSFEFNKEEGTLSLFPNVPCEKMLSSIGMTDMK